MTDRDDARVDRDGPGRRESDKPSPWQNPGLWVSILGFLLSLCVVVGSMVNSQLRDLHSDMTNLTISTTKTNTQQAEQIRELQEKIAKIETKQATDETNQTAYNYDLSKSLTVIKTKMETK